MSTFCGAMVRLNKILIFGFSKMDKVELRDYAKNEFAIEWQKYSEAKGKF